MIVNILQVLLGSEGVEIIQIFDSQTPKAVAVGLVGYGLAGTTKIRKFIILKITTDFLDNLSYFSVKSED